MPECFRVLVATNYYKGSLSAVKAADIIADSINELHPDYIVNKCPLADGGDGTVEAVYKSIGGDLLTTEVCDPLFRKVNAVWLKKNDIAVIEAAKANGISFLNADELNPFITTTYGVGQLILDAAYKGCKKIIIGVGGSATNDAGIGALRALGIKFLDKQNKEIDYNIKSFTKISSIDLTDLNPLLRNIEIIVATDVMNPLTGLNGTSKTFAVQKGAKDEDLKTLDNLLYYFADISSSYFHKDNRNLSGSGAAGGLAFGLSQYLDAKIESGFDLISEFCGLEEKIKQADLIVTGEGRLDEQSLWGKAPVKVAELANKYNKPCLAIVGSQDRNINWGKYFKRVYTLENNDVSTEYAVKNAALLLRKIVLKEIDFNDFL